MAKFALECPHCGTVNKASTFILSKKKIVCASCKNEIDVKANRMAVGKCPTCGEVAFDKAKGKCPICKQHIDFVSSAKATSIEDLKALEKNGSNAPLILCPQCNCSIQPSRQHGDLLCPVCDYKFDGYEEVFRILQKEKLVSETGVSVIKYEGDNNTFIWKHPIEDFNLGTQLIVHESQEAIFCLNGQALDLFGSGRYSLETENIPMLRKVAEMPTGKQSPFHAEVYFINMSTQMGIKWGTDSRVRFIDPETNIPLDIGASGELNLQVSDSRKLLVKLVGTTKGLSRNQLLDAADSTATNGGWANTLRGYFRPLVMTAVKSYLANVIKEQHIDILEIDSHLEILSNALREKVSAGFEEYGLFVPQFYITNVSLPEDDKNFKALRDLRSSSYLGVRQAEVEADIIAAQRKKVLERQNTDLEIAKFEAEKQRIKAQADADAMTLKHSAVNELKRQRGLYDAEVMGAKGYTQKDVLNAEVQKEYAKSMGQIGSNAGGGGGGSNIMSDMLGLGMGMAVASTVGGQVNSVMKQGFNPNVMEQSSTPQTPAGWSCSCGNKDNQGAFCSACGKPKPVLWDCPACGAKGISGAFCSTCGKPKPVLWDCPACGAKGNSGAFCSTCGHSAADSNTWDCSCGQKGITGNFCSNCGKRKAEEKSTWDCACGKKGISGNFCSQCGAKREG